VPRTDENQRQLKALLDYLLDGDIEAKDIYGALGISSSTYYRRNKEADYPNAEELRLLANRFRLSYPDLQIRFGLMTHEEVQSYVESTAPMPTAIKAPVLARAVKKSSNLRLRHDAPPL
jgi:hypothetical protein